MSKERRKVRTGRVVSDKMDKTVVVAVRWSQRNRLYRKPMRRITKFYAHDATNDCSLGDLVRIEETRPISRQKNWRVIDVLERREVAEVRPMELDREFLESQMRGQDAEAETEVEVQEDAVALALDVAEEPDTGDSEAVAEAETLALEEAVLEMDAPEEIEEHSALDDAEEPAPIDDAEEPTAIDDVEEPSAIDDDDEPTAIDDANEPTTLSDADEPTAIDDAEEPVALDDAEEPTAINDADDAPTAEAAEADAPEEEKQP